MTETGAAFTDLERIERLLQAAYGGAISDALKHLGVRNTILSDRIRPLAEGMVLAGRAITVKTHTRTAPPDPLPASRATAGPEDDVPQRDVMRAISNAPPGSVLVYDTGGDQETAHFGELSATLAHSHGARGLVMTGNVRDVRRILEIPDFPVFTAGTCPAAYDTWEIIGVNDSIEVPGHLTRYVTVHPGDFIFADHDGVQVIPGGLIDEVIAAVEAITSKETRERELLAAGMEIDEVYQTIGIL